MIEKSLLDAGWTPEDLKNMDPVMVKARYKVYSFVESIEDMKRGLMRWTK